MLCLGLFSQKIIRSNIHLIDYLKEPSMPKEMIAVLPVEQETAWIDPSIRYLGNSLLCKDKIEACKLVVKADCLCLSHSKLYQRSYYNLYLICMGSSETYEGESKNHVEERLLVNTL